MTNETHRFFLFSGNHQASFDELAEKGNQARNLPDGEGTERWLAPWEKLFLDPETGVDKLYCVKRSLILPTDRFDLDGIEEINLKTYLALLQWEPPVEDDLEMIDELELVE
jgi:hypothetical protein